MLEAAIAGALAGLLISGAVYGAVKEARDASAEQDVPPLIILAEGETPEDVGEDTRIIYTFGDPATVGRDLRK